MNPTYAATARLLTEIAPVVFESGIFALEGGTAINLFLRDMPRLSVDLDLVFTDHRNAPHRRRSWVVVARTNKCWYPPFDELRARTIGGQLEVVRHTPSVLVYRVEERVTGQ
jgi:hypothetical protein